MTSIYLKVNCGFAHVAIRTLSQCQVGKTHSQINTQERARQFQELFTAPDEYFTSSKGRDSLFDRHCKQILSAFGTMKNADKREYIECLLRNGRNSLNTLRKHIH